MLDNFHAPPPDFKDDRGSPLGRVWHWLVHDNRPPIQRIEVEHKTESRFWLGTRICGNAALASCSLLVAGAAIGTVVTAIGVLSERPELPIVAQIMFHRIVDQWEIDHGFPCVAWVTHDREGHDIAMSGGPKCPKSASAPDLPVVPPTLTPTGRTGGNRT